MKYILILSIALIGLAGCSKEQALKKFEGKRMKLRLNDPKCIGVATSIDFKDTAFVIDRIGRGEAYHTNGTVEKNAVIISFNYEGEATDGLNLTVAKITKNCIISAPRNQMGCVITMCTD